MSPPARTSRSHDNHHSSKTPSTSSKVQQKTDKTPTDKPLTDGLDVNNYTKWTVQDVAAYLKSKYLKEEAQLFSKEQISGVLLPDLTEELLGKMGIKTMGRRLQILQAIKPLRQRRDLQKGLDVFDRMKVFNDPIHGHIEVHPLLVKVLDTPQFQRLRYIKQLGCSYFVFPGAAHNRFEHSLGVSHLAGLLAKTLKHRQPELDITDNDVLCVQIAGLCHDLGHGPFSHLFDDLFIPVVRPNLRWKHEQASVKMFEYMIEANDLKEVFESFGLNETDLIFIKEQIAGPLESNKKVYKGRSKDKSFLYEIVANKRNGIDVDKWDYFARDCHNLGISNNFDCHRFMKFARIIEVEGKKQICSRDKEVGNLYDMFHTRNSLHRRAYQHKVTKIIDSMIVEALVKANDHFKISGTKGKLVKMSEAVDDMVAYTKLTDNVILEIMQSDDPNLAASRHILENIHKRHLYKCVGQTQPPENTIINKREIPVMLQEIAVALSEEDLGGPQLTPDNLVIHVVDLNYGMGAEDPIKHVRFYSKGNLNQAVMVRKNQVSQMLPEKFAEQHIRLYSKLRDRDSIYKASLCFKKWCEVRRTKAKAGYVDPELTPAKSPSAPHEDEPAAKKSRTRLSM
ncbi:deoxynucleoside triphosphate triphosphohydrolase SAMHD1-like [Amphiura filiformis]|uniref:deoxynucleoside triphosphate triphosphohydrolase SAMHD1-like n=1 Tax=Amphiura filiformis TaxID=82378 RepID=UPI003B2166C2